MNTNFGFVKVAAGVPSVKVANCEHNIESIAWLIQKAAEEKVEIVCLPELCITAYTCGDLFKSHHLLETAEMQLLQLADVTRTLNIVAIVGVPVCHKNQLFNCAAVIFKGKIMGFVPKSYLPNHSEACETRWFASGLCQPHSTVHIAGQFVPFGRKLIFDMGYYSFGIEIGEDLSAPIAPSSILALHGADIMFNLSAASEGIGKYERLRTLANEQSIRGICGYVLANAGHGESTQDLAFSGKGFIFDNGRILAETKPYNMDEQLIISDIDVERIHNERRNNTIYGASIGHTAAHDDEYKLIEVRPMYDYNDFHLNRTIDAYPFIPTDDELGKRCEEIFNMQICGLAKRIQHTHVQTVVVGISGGLDSTLALLVCVATFDRLGMNRKGIVGITMPGFGTTNRTYTNATNLMKFLGISIREISIAEACRTHFRDLGMDENSHDVTYENSQARERTQILMDAANQMNGLVVGTGDLSELALGWTTYNGDHMSMYGVNASIPKTLIKHIISWVAESLDTYSKTTLMDIVDTPISPELLPADEDGDIAQKTEDLVGPYELHDFFIYHVLRNGFKPSKIFFLATQAFKPEKYDKETILHWLTIFHRRFFNQQFKRSCLPDGPKVGSCCLSPRGDWHMPSDADSATWLEECKTLME